jgi:hypothetical protein
MDDATRREPDDSAEHQRILAALGELGFCLPGSVAEERTRCGKPGCRCKADPPVLHGPYYHWTRKIDGKTVGRYLSNEQLARYEPWFANARQARDLFTELEALSLAIAERGEGWDPQAPPTGHRRRNQNPRPKTGSRRSDGELSS